MTKFEIMMKVAELNLLRTNKEELARLEGYMFAYDGYEDAESEIKDNGIFSQKYIGPGIKGEVKDITFEILLTIYGEYGEDKDDKYYSILEEMIYDELENK